MINERHEKINLLNRRVDRALRFLPKGQRKDEILNDLKDEIQSLSRSLPPETLYEGWCDVPVFLGDDR